MHRHMSWVRLLEDAIVELAQGTEVYKIYNVTEADAGVYACVVGTDVAHAHLVAHLEVCIFEYRMPDFRPYNPYIGYHIGTYNIC